jgi:hypothetical protein
MRIYTYLLSMCYFLGRLRCGYLKLMYGRTRVAVALSSSAKKWMWRQSSRISCSPQGNMTGELEEEKEDTVTVLMYGFKTKTVM